MLNNQSGIEVLNWGKTDDSEPHELVAVSLAVVAPVVFNYLVVPGLRWVSEKLAQRATEETIKGVTKIIEGLRHKQEEKKILDFSIGLPDRTVITLFPPDYPGQGGEIRIRSADGSQYSVTYKNKE